MVPTISSYKQSRLNNRQADSALGKLRNPRVAKISASALRLIAVFQHVESIVALLRPRG